MKLKINNDYIQIFNMNTFKKKLKGLMGKRHPIKNGYLFKSNGIHTFFMFQSIDVVLTNKQGQILFIKENLKPFRIILPKRHVYYTYEFPIDTAKHFKIGQILTLEEK